MSFKYIFILAIVIFSISFGQSKQEFSPLDNTEELKARVAQLADKTFSLKTSFVQEKHLSILSKAIHSDLYF